MPWYDFTPSWQRIERNRTTSNSEAMQASLIPLKAQQMQLDAKQQALQITGEGIRQQADAAKLNFELATMPDKIQEIKQGAQIQELQLNQIRSEGAAWEKDVPKLAPWTSLPWEQRVTTPPPAVTSDKAMKTIMSQERADAMSAQQKAEHDKALSASKVTAEQNKQIAKFNDDVWKSGLNAGQLAELHKTLLDGSPTQASFEKLSEFKNFNLAASATVVEHPELPGWKFLRQKNGTEIPTERPSHTMTATERTGLSKLIVKAQAKLKNPSTDPDTKTQLVAEIKGYQALLGGTDTPSPKPVATPGTAWGAFESREQVRDAFKNSQITRDQAEKILREKFGMK